MNYICDICKSTFSSVTGFQYHINNHVCEKYKCLKCDKMCQNNATYKYHLSHNICDKKLISKVNVKLQTSSRISINNTTVNQSINQNILPINQNILSINQNISPINQNILPTDQNILPINNLKLSNKDILSLQLKIPKKLRIDVWNKWVGHDKALSVCLLCNISSIHIAKQWHCGHIVSIYNHGDTTFDNLRPICSGCNLSMGTKNMIDYCKYYTGASKRLGFNSISTSDILKCSNHKTCILVSLKKVMTQLIENKREPIYIYIIKNPDKYNNKTIGLLEKYLDISEEDEDYDKLKRQIIDILISLKDIINTDRWTSDLFAYINTNIEID